jgi:subtilisin-like proprotein convertase family protein
MASSRVRRQLPVLLACSLAAVASLRPAAAVVFSNPAAISITDANCTGPTPQPASPYPSTITVSGLAGTVTKVTVTIAGLTHTSPDDVSLLLVGPGGGSQHLVFLGDAGGGTDVNAITLTFDDAGASAAPDVTALATGTYRPTDYASGVNTFPAPAPAPTNRAAPQGAATLATAFNGINPNGTWSLYATDDSCGDTGSISGGWALNVTIAAAAATTTVVQSSLNPSRTGQSVTFTATVTSSGGPVTEGTVSFTDNGASMGGPVAVNASGQAGFTTNTLTEGDHTILATYNGTVNFATSSGSLNQRVDNDTVVEGSSYCNPGDLTVANQGASFPYPSNVFVVGAQTQISEVTLTVQGVTHTAPGDIELLLVGPEGQNLRVLSDAGDSNDASDITVVFDDDAAGPLAASAPWGTNGTTITVQPTQLGAASFPAPAPAVSGATALSTFDATNPNGTWSLYFNDDSLADGGSMTGWCLNLTTVPVELQSFSVD